jgi:hypothetical protein
MVVFFQCLRAVIFGTNERNKIKKNTFFEKRTGEVVENKGTDYIDSRKRTGNEPKHEAEKLLETRSCGKTNRKQTKNKATDLVENTGWLKNKPKTKRRILRG